jgi:proteic killer suppression protein
VFTIIFSKSAEKDLSKIPKHIRQSLQHWITTVKLLGLDETRKLKGFHDEPLKGARRGQRSVRLSREWRAFYKLEKDLIIIEVNKHDYKTKK